MRWPLTLTVGLLLASPGAAWGVGVEGRVTQDPGPAGCIHQTGDDGCGDGRALLQTTDVAASPDGTSVYATSQVSSGVAVFARDSTSGALNQQPGISGCISQTGADGCADGHALDGPNGVAVSPDGSSVYAASAFSDGVAVLGRAPANGALTQDPGSAGCIDHFGNDGCADGHGLAGANDVAVSADGTSVYIATNRGVAVLARDPANGTVTQDPGSAGCIDHFGEDGCADGHGLFGAWGVAVSADGTSVYAATFAGVAVLARDPATGELTQDPGSTGCINELGDDGCAEGRGLNGPTGIAVSADGTSVYVASQISSAVAVFARDPATGELTQEPGTAGCITQAGSGGCADGHGLGGARGVEVSADGTSVYVASFTSDGVAVLARDTATGALTQDPGSAGCIRQSAGDGCADGHGLDGAEGLEVSPDGIDVYVGSRLSDAVAVLARDVLPECEPVSAAVAHNVPRVLDLACTDRNGDPLAIALPSGGPASGSLLQAGAAGDLQALYTPLAGFAGTDGFSYAAVGAGQESEPAAVTLDVAPGATPVCVPGGASTVSDVPALLTLECAANGDPLTFGIASPPANGGLGAVGLDGRVDYAPAAGFAGADGFSFTATSAFGTSTPVPFSIGVGARRRGPAGAGGAPGAPGPAAPASPEATRLAIALFTPTLRRRAGEAAKIRLLTTLPAELELQVTRSGRTVARVKGVAARAGRAAIVWNGRVTSAAPRRAARGRSAQTGAPAPPGLYRVRVVATAGAQRATAVGAVRVLRQRARR